MWKEREHEIIQQKKENKFFVEKLKKFNRNSKI